MLVYLCFRNRDDGNFSMLCDSLNASEFNAEAFLKCIELNCSWFHSYLAFVRNYDIVNAVIGIEMDNNSNLRTFVHTRSRRAQHDNLFEVLKQPLNRLNL